MKQLGIEVEEKRNNPFNDNLKVNDRFYYIRDDGVVDEYYYIREDDCINKVNCFNDKDFAKQVCLHELLNRKLLKYAWDNEAEADTIMFEDKPKYYIAQNVVFPIFTVLVQYQTKCADIYFSEQKVAENAIKDVVEPFMKEHPEFVW